jgi:hypothetical protein
MLKAFFRIKRGKNEVEGEAGRNDISDDHFSTCSDLIKLSQKGRKTSAKGAKEKSEEGLRLGGRMGIESVMVKGC